MSRVDCRTCGTTIDLTTADVTGLGYRCAACSLKVSLAADGGYNDVGDHLTLDERKQRSANATSQIIGGAATAIAGVFCVIFVHVTIGVIAVLGGLGGISYGIAVKREMTGQLTR